MRDVSPRDRRIAWKQLKMLAVNEEKTAHALLLEAVNRLFQDRGLPPVA